MKLNIIKQRKVFDACYRKGKSKPCKTVIIQKLKSSDDNYSYFGITVSKKVSKKAVDRNKIRRRIKTIIQNLIKSNKFEKGYYYVIIARSSSLHRDFEDFSNDIKYCLRKLKN